MGWTKVKRIAVLPNEEPCIILKDNRISFNISFVKITELEKFQFVRIFTDDEERKIGFEFLKDNSDTDTFKITGNREKGFYFTSKDLFEKAWVKKVSKMQGSNIFPVKKESKLWVIKLMPSFEHQVKRIESNKISSELKGIYRYLDANINVVYIGKGNIRKRLLEEKRSEWLFDYIEYSVIQDDELAYEWEAFWINKYRESKGGELPKYNMISGISSE